MSSLTQQIDRLSQITKSIATTVANTCACDGVPETAKPFTVAVLDTPLGDLIRDIDTASELGLFRLVQPAHALSTESAPLSPHRRDIERVAFHGATPLRRPMRGLDPMKAPSVPEPEVYAEAAVKYISRYQNIRAMPRACAQVDSVIEQLRVSRTRISQLQQQLKEIHADIETSSHPKLQADVEQRGLEILQERLALLRQQKENISRKRLPPIRHKLPVTTSRAPDPLAALDSDEIGFWTTPTTTGRTFQLSSTNGLMTDERITPVALSPPPQTSRGLMDQVSPAQPIPLTPQLSLSNFTPSPIECELSLPPPSSPPRTTFTLPREGQMDGNPQVIPPGTPLQESRIKVTLEVDQIISKIWSTIGDIIMPGHLNNVTKPMATKATIIHLRHLANQTSVPLSPSATSVSSLASASMDGPTFQQIMVAHMLLCLLSSEALSYSLPMNVIKDSLLTKATELGVPTLSQSSTRIIYMCVAKRLIQIDRRRGGQTIKFDLAA